MKKLMLAFAMLLTLSTVSFAQTKQSGKKKDKVATTAPRASSAKQESTAPVAEDMTKPASSSKKSGPVKKDGTPDKRFKANKTATDTTVHKKKDGTPDKRFKENKKKN